MSSRLPGRYRTWPFWRSCWRNWSLGSWSNCLSGNNLTWPSICLPVYGRPLAIQGGPAKVKPLTFLLVIFECIGKIQWFLAHVNYTQQQVVWCKFYANFVIINTYHARWRHIRSTRLSQSDNLESAIFIKTGSYSQNIIINANINKY